MGPPGPQGEQGNKGDTGETGEKGGKGDTGEKGETGDKGDTGEKGDKGDTGETGPAGSDPVALTAASWQDGELKAGSVHWYSFSALSFITYPIQWNDAGNGDNTKDAKVKVSAYKADGTSLFTDQTNGYTTPKTITGYTGTVYLRVESILSAVGGTYAIKYNDPAATASALTSGSWQTGNIATASSTQLYKFTAASGTIYGVQWNDTYDGSGTYTGKVNVSAYRSDGTAFFRDAAVGYTAPRTISGYTGTVYLQVTPNSSSTGTYAVRYEAYNPAASASALASGSWQTGTLTAVSNVHWYRFTAASGTTYSVSWDDSYSGSGTYTGDLYVSAYKADGTALFTDADTAYSTPQTISGYTGTVYLQVKPYGGASYLGTYAIKYQ
ncbi:MAG: collagen-like protein [Treponema sp.]|jgi:hypothetical protein|nr:collagen-like protein [Treponema sp.]